jgi:hypothetical protein
MALAAKELIDMTPSFFSVWRWRKSRLNRDN